MDYNTNTNIDEIEINVGTQTEIILQNVDKSEENIIEDFMNTKKECRGFRHLILANQTYWEHFCDSFGYFKTSLQASFYFLCHAFWPDIFEKSGSKTISELNDKIRSKYVKRILEIKSEMSNN